MKTPKQTIKPTKTKAEIRAELAREIDQFLSSGGKVKAIPQGISGNEGNVNLFSQSTAFGPRQERTPIPDVVKELDERKKPHKTYVKKPSGPRKRLIKDDFGEPIRWVWKD